MWCNQALANTSTPSCFTSFHLESNQGIPLSDRCLGGLGGGGSGTCPKKEILMGISWRSPTVNCHLYTFPLSTVDTELSGWDVCVRQLCPKRFALFLISSVYYNSL